MEPKGLPEEIKYVQLWLLFKVDLFQTSDNTLVTKELTLVHMYQMVPPNRLSRLNYVWRNQMGLTHLETTYKT
jgi:hypothetical protein